MMTAVSDFGAQQDAVLHYGLSQARLQKSLFSLPPHLRASSFKKDKRFESELASEACYFQRRDLGFAKIIHEHNITEAVHGEKR